MNSHKRLFPHQSGRWSPWPGWTRLSCVAIACVAALSACTDATKPVDPLTVEPLFSESGADMVNLTARGSNATINGAYLEAYSPATSTGSGVYLSFVRVSSNRFDEEGYNTSGRPVQYDENTASTFTHDLPLNAVPLQPCGFTDGFCREFNADINQTTNEPLLDLLRVRLFLSPTPGINNAEPASPTFGQSDGTVLVWDLDGAGNVFVRFDYRNSTGLPFDSSHIHGWRNVLTGMEIAEVPKMAVYEGRNRPRFG